MEKLVGKLLVTTGLLISGSVAFLPLTSHAMTNVGGVFDCKGITNPNGGQATSTASGVKTPAGASAPKNCATATYMDAPEDSEVEYTTDGAAIIKVNVADILALDAAAADSKTHDSDVAGNHIQAYPDMIAHGRIYANVRSAKPYTISLSASTPQLTSETDDSFIIPARDNPTVGKSGWGVANGIQGSLDDIDFNAQTYKAITMIPTVFYDGGADDEITTTNFPLAVSVSSNLPRDSYSTEVTVTAAVKN